MTNHFARLIAERIAAMPEASRAVFAALVSAGIRRMLDTWRADLAPHQRDVEAAAFVSSLVDALEAMTIPGARADDAADFRDWPSTIH
jgi:hypothetical protein